MSNCIGEGCTHPTHSSDPAVRAQAVEAEQAEKERVLARSTPRMKQRVRMPARDESGRRKARRRIQKASRRGNR